MRRYLSLPLALVVVALPGFCEIARADTTSTSFAAKATSAIDAEAVAAYAAPDWKLVWSDEFDYNGAPDPAKWGYEVGFVRNNEAQFYTKDRRENARVEGGQLIVTARKEPWSADEKKADYTSASLHTNRRYTFTYGKVEIAARVPRGRGVWPALWTLGANIKDVPWPLSGEIDIMEFVGHTPNKVHFTAHTEAFNHSRSTHRTTSVDIASPFDSFHRYGIIWTPEKITWFLDGRRVSEFANDGQGEAHWPFDHAQYLLINLAIGGNWGGEQGIAPDIFPAELRIDYVRIWKR